MTIDAMGTQTKIVKKIVENNADYCLALKGNHSNLHDDVRFYFENQSVENKKVVCDKDHGRIEKREYFLETEIDWIERKSDWCNFNAIGTVRSTVTKNDKTSCETRYFITSLTDVDRLADAV